MKMTIEHILKEHKGKSVSGEYIAKRLGISRAGVWKKIKKLRSKGYMIDGKRREGYRIVSDLEFNDLKKFAYKNSDIHYFEKIGSTQTYAKKLAALGYKEKTLVVAQTQFSSYGRMQRKWLSQPGGLWFSLILRPVCTPVAASALTIVMGLSVAQVLRKIPGIPNAQIKWPNDVLIGGKKVCGILTEMQSEIDRVAWMVIGVGVNVNNQIAQELRCTGTSVAAYTNQPVALPSILNSILKVFFANYRIFLKSGLKTFICILNKYSYIYHKGIIIKTGNETVRGIAAGIDISGSLLVKTRDGRQRSIHSGEVVLK